MSVFGGFIIGGVKYTIRDLSIGKIGPLPFTKVAREVPCGTFFFSTGTPSYCPVKLLKGDVLGSSFTFVVELTGWNSLKCQNV